MVFRKRTTAAAARVPAAQGGDLARDGQDAGSGRGRGRDAARAGGGQVVAPAPCGSAPVEGLASAVADPISPLALAAGVGVGVGGAADTTAFGQVVAGPWT